MRTVHLPIAEPCHEDWDAMDRVERGRFCQVCTKQVHDLSSMTETQARTLLREQAGNRICVRYCHDTEGQVRFRDEAPAAPANTCSSPRRVGLAGAAMAAAALAACTPHDNPDVPRPDDLVEDHAVVGQLPMETVPEIVTDRVLPPDIKGEMVAIEPPPEPKPFEVKGDIAATPMPEPEPIEVKGNLAAEPEPAPKPEPEVAPIMGLMVDPAVDFDELGGSAKEPCDE